MCEVLPVIPLEGKEPVGDRGRILVVAAEDSNDKLDKHLITKTASLHILENRSRKIRSSFQ